MCWWFRLRTTLSVAPEGMLSRASTGSSASVDARCDARVNTTRSATGESTVPSCHAEVIESTYPAVPMIGRLLYRWSAWDASARPDSPAGRVPSQAGVIAPLPADQTAGPDAALPRDLHLGRAPRHARLQGGLPARLPAAHRVRRAVPRRRHHRRLGAEEERALAAVAQRHRAEGAAQGAQGHARGVRARQSRRVGAPVRGTALRRHRHPRGRRAHDGERAPPVGRARRLRRRRDAARALARLRRRRGLRVQPAG